MGLAKALFVAIDKLYDPLQNKRRMTKFKDVDFVIDTDIVYDESAPDICKLDTYRVAREGKYPVLFYIHGGGFVAGDKKYRRALSRWSANQGYFVVNVNYGLGPDCLFPEPLRQIVRAFNWVEKHAEELNLDTDRMIVSGDSAGGQLACLMLAAQSNPELLKRLKIEKEPLPFKGGLLVCGAYDPEGMAKNPLSNKMWVEMTGYGRKHLREFPDFDLLRPSDFITENFPKNVFITYARFDAFVGGNEKLVLDKLDEYKIPHLVYRAKGAGEHCFHLWHYRRPTSALFFEYARQYIEQLLADKDEIKLVKPPRKEMKARRKGAKYQ